MNARYAAVPFPCASMRPPHECGGKLRVTVKDDDALTSFNGAPARMRGKTYWLAKDDHASVALQ